MSQIHAEKITTDTHTITAAAYGDSDINAGEFNLNGHTLKEIVDDALDYLNDTPELNHDFDVEEENGNDEEGDIILKGTEEDPESGDTLPSRVKISWYEN